MEATWPVPEDVGVRIEDHLLREGDEPLWIGAPAGQSEEDAPPPPPAAPPATRRVPRVGSVALACSAALAACVVRQVVDGHVSLLPAWTAATAALVGTVSWALRGSTEDPVETAAVAPRCYVAIARDGLWVFTRIGDVLNATRYDRRAIVEIRRAGRGTVTDLMVETPVATLRLPALPVDASTWSMLDAFNGAIRKGAIPLRDRP